MLDGCRAIIWRWFVELIMRDLEIREDGDAWMFMTDKQKGLIDALDSLLPNFEHRFCVNNLYSNFRLQHEGLALKLMVLKAAKCSRIVDFQNVISKVGETNKEVFKWFAKRLTAIWSRSFFRPDCKSDMLTNNMWSPSM